MDHSICPNCKGKRLDDFWDHGTMCPCCDAHSWRFDRIMDQYEVSNREIAAQHKLDWSVKEWHELNSDYRGPFTSKIYEFVGLDWGEYLMYQTDHYLSPEVIEKIL